MEPQLTPKPAERSPTSPVAAISSPRLAEAPSAELEEEASAQHVAAAEQGSMDVEALEAMILARLDDDQAQDVVVIDLKGKSSLADAIVIASGRSQRHVSAIADHLLRAIKSSGWGRAQVEGLPQADWVLIDASDIIVHLFRPEVRAFYNIEKIWSVEPPAAAGRTRHGFVDPATSDGGPLEQEAADAI